MSDARKHFERGAQLFDSAGSFDEALSAYAAAHTSVDKRHAGSLDPGSAQVRELTTPMELRRGCMGPAYLRSIQIMHKPPRHAPKSLRRSWLPSSSAYRLTMLHLARCSPTRSGLTQAEVGATDETQRLELGRSQRPSSQIRRAQGVANTVRLNLLHTLLFALWQGAPRIVANARPRRGIGQTGLSAPSISTAITPLPFGARPPRSTRCDPVC